MPVMGEEVGLELKVDQELVNDVILSRTDFPTAVSTDDKPYDVNLTHSYKEYDFKSKGYVEKRRAISERRLQDSMIQEAKQRHKDDVISPCGATHKSDQYEIDHPKYLTTYISGSVLKGMFWYNTSDGSTHTIDRVEVPYATVMPKVVALDIDGTIYSPGFGSIDGSLSEAIELLKDNGIKVVTSSDELISDQEKLLGEYKFDKLYNVKCDGSKDYSAIIEDQNIHPSELYVVDDSFDGGILPAIKIGASYFHKANNFAQAQDPIFLLVNNKILKGESGKDIGVGYIPALLNDPIVE